MITLPPALHALTNHAAKENSRYAIAGIGVWDTECRGFPERVCCSTDGRRLAMFRCAKAPEWPCIPGEKGFIIPADLIIGLGRPMLAKRADDFARYTATLDPGGVVLSLTLGKKTVIGQAIDGAFPPVEEVIPNRDNPPIGGVIVFSAAFIKDAAVLIHELHRFNTAHEGKTPMEWRHYAPGKPAVICAGMDLRGFGCCLVESVVMPLAQPGSDLGKSAYEAAYEAAHKPEKPEKAKKATEPVAA